MIRQFCWTVCQVGAREHYALAGAFADFGRLDALLTDLWVPPGSVLSRMVWFAGGTGQAFRDRYRRGMDGALVVTPGFSTTARIVSSRIHVRRAWSWDGVHRDNQRLGRAFADALRRSRVLEQHGPRAVFAYSYAALEVLREAKLRGAMAILGQIDPGPGEASHVEAIAAAHGLVADKGLAPGEAYWARWREECSIADRITVNSNWSRDLLVAEGIDRSKIAVVPLIYTPPIGDVSRPHAHKTNDRLEFLFLGQVNVRKGIVELIDAMRQLMDRNVRLTVIGPVEARLHSFLASGVPANVRILGKVPRSKVGKHYGEADIFVLPTHSDGFGLTQLEAMGYGLPVLASRHCGAVVRDGIDGRLLDRVTPGAIAKRIHWFCDHREQLARMRDAAVLRVHDFNPKRVAGMLDAVAADSARCTGCDA